MSFGMCEEEDIGLEWNGILSVYIYLYRNEANTDSIASLKIVVWATIIYIKVKTSTWQMGNRMSIV